MRFTTRMSQPRIVANLLAPATLTGRRRSSVSFLGEADTDVHTVSRGAVKVENTYQLKPNDKLSTPVVENVLESVTEEMLGHVTQYDSDACKSLSTNIADAVKQRLKDHLVQRYRLVCVVHIAELTSQSVSMASRCLWSPEHDNYWSYEYRNAALCAVVTVYAVYLE